jgi:hypothetical protein
MLTRQRSGGFPFIRIKTGSGLRHPGLRVHAKEELTSTNGLIPRICITALNLIAMSLKSQCEIGYLLQCRADDTSIDTEAPPVTPEDWSEARQLPNPQSPLTEENYTQQMTSQSFDELLLKISVSSARIQDAVRPANPHIRQTKPTLR